MTAKFGAPEPNWLTRTSPRGRLFVATGGLLFMVLLASAIVGTSRGDVSSLTTALLAAGTAPALMVLAMHAARLLLLLLPAQTPGGPAQTIADLVVVVPVILRNRRGIDPLRRCVAANLPHVGRTPLTLLIDLGDADAEKTPQDAALIEETRACFTRETERGEVLVLFRARRYDAVDLVWRGWERKRGKIEAFCRWLRGDARSDFAGTPPLALSGLDALVTIDLDTRLDADTLRSLVRAVDADAAIVAPMIKVTRPPDARIFERLHVPRLWTRPFDPRPTFNQSRLGWDLFHGKGLILIDRFLARTAGRVPERTMLSHDLVEATLAGAVSTASAIVSEPIPATRTEWARRQTRWVRGDFQNLRWVFSGDLPVVMRLHLFEVAVAHTVPLGILGAITAAYVTMEGAAASWVALAELILVHPALSLAPMIAAMQTLERRGSLRVRARRAAGTLVVAVATAILAVVYLPRDAAITARAALLVAWRTWWSGRDLLAWDDAAVPAPRPGTARRVTTAVVAGAALWIATPGAGFLVALWLLAPAILDLRPVPPGPRGAPLIPSRPGERRA